MLSVCLLGCSSHSTTADILIVDGCMVDIKGISAAQAAEIAKNWKFGKDCELIVGTILDNDDK